MGAGTEWAMIGIALVVTVWAFIVRSRVIDRLWSPVFRVTRGVTSAALLSVLLYAAYMAAYCVAQYAVHSTLDGWFAGTVALVLAFVYAPMAMMPLPDRDRAPYADLRRELEKVGASPRQARASAWATGPLSFFGLGVTFTAPFVTIAL